MQQWSSRASSSIGEGKKRRMGSEERREGGEMYGRTTRTAQGELSEASNPATSPRNPTVKKELNTEVQGINPAPGRRFVFQGQSTLTARERRGDDNLGFSGSDQAGKQLGDGSRRYTTVLPCGSKDGCTGCPLQVSLCVTDIHAHTHTRTHTHTHTHTHAHTHTHTYTRSWGGTGWYYKIPHTARTRIHGR
jgi:hypothetical protein